VHPDDRAAGHDATAWLLQRGHRRIAYVDYSHSTSELDDAHYSAADRRAGYLKAMAEAGLDPLPIQPRNPIPLADREQHISQWLTRADRPTAVVTYGNSDAEIVVHAARAMGMKLPDELVVTGFANGAMIIGGLKLPTWKVPTDDLGKEAVGMLLEKIKQPQGDLPSRTVPFEFEPEE
jgi:LacI family transcriptional regulator